MKRTLMVSVAALALAAGSTVALSQGQGGGNTPMANPSGPSGGAGPSGAAGVSPSEKDTHPGGKAGAPAKGAQDRTIPEKQKSTQQAPQGAPAATTKQSQEEKSGQPATRQSQAPANEKQQQGQAAPHQQPGQAAPTQQSQGQSTTGTKQGASSQSTTTTKQGAAERPMKSSNVSLTTEQKTKIRTTVLTSSAPRVTNVNFDIKIGTVVPRTVRVAPLPATIIEIEPEWRGFMYFVYADEIIVVEPGTLRIVAVLDV